MEPNDPVASRKVLLRLCDPAGDGQGSITPNLEAIRRYERPRLASEYGEAIHSLSGGKSVSA